MKEEYKIDIIEKSSQEDNFSIYREKNSGFIHSFEGGGKYPIHANYISSINEDQNAKI